MKIFFRYLFMRLFQTFFIVLAGCTVIWVMADLYGNMDDFLDHKVSFLLVLRFYSLQIPRMLVQVLPATMLFSTLFTLMSLNRRSELVALQSGGMAPIWIFSPFFLFAFIWVGILAFELCGPACPLNAAQAEVTRERLLKQVKGQGSGRNVFINLPYVDSVNHIVWFFQSLDTGTNKAKGIEILKRDAQGHDMVKYFAQSGQWKDGFWKLTGVLKIIYAPGAGVLEQKTFDQLDLPDITTPPKQLSLIVSQPDQLTLGQLSQYIKTSSQSEEHLAEYRTEWWYRVLYPLSLLVLILFSLMQGAKADRRGTAAGVGVSILVLLGFTFLLHIMMAFGSHNRMPPVVSVAAAELIFGVIGLHFLAEFWKSWYGPDDEEEEEPAK
jgi:lipopolysaccharide export system permease protein